MRALRTPTIGAKLSAFKHLTVLAALLAFGHALGFAVEGHAVEDGAGLLAAVDLRLAG